jgi:hypothetical protein
MQFRLWERKTMRAGKRFWGLSVMQNSKVLHFYQCCRAASFLCGSTLAPTPGKNFDAGPAPVAPAAPARTLLYCKATFLK